MSEAPRAGRKVRHERHLAPRFDVADQPVKSVPPLEFQALDKDSDRAAAGKPDLPRRLVLDAELERSGLARCDHLGGLRDDLCLDASPRHRAQEIALAVDHELAADRLRRRAPGLYDGGERDAPALIEPVERLCQHEIGCTHRLAFPSAAKGYSAERFADRAYEPLRKYTALQLKPKGSAIRQPVNLALFAPPGLASES